MSRYKEHRLLLTSELSLIDDKDDAMVCLYTVLYYTTIRDTCMLYLTCKSGSV